MSWLALNTGSSSLKFALYDEEVRSPLVRGSVDWRGDQAELTVRAGSGPKVGRPADVGDPGGAAHAAIRAVLDAGHPPGEVRGVGHRIVHGGTRFRASVPIDEAVEADIRGLTPLAPLHNPPALDALAAARGALPAAPQVAVFDTAFFRDLPPESITLPVPRRWTEEWGIRRFGFHGISHEYCAGRAAAILGRDPDSLRLVICHLGNGCSASAVRGGKPVDTTMSFTPLDGLMMGTRPGAVDPGALLYLLKEGRIDRDGMDDALNHHAGLLGVSGVSGDFRKVEEAAGRGDDRARLALAMYEARVTAAVGALAATLGGLDALVFAAGVGENGASLRASVCGRLGFIGVRLDGGRNEASPRDADIAAADSPVRVLVIRTQEELMIARDVRRIVGSPDHG